MVKDHLKKTGEDLRKLVKAKDATRQMLEAFPALQTLERYNDIKTGDVIEVFTMERVAATA